MKYSYARTVKEELARIFDDEEEYLRAELAALLKVGGNFIDGRIDFTSSNAAVARKVINLLKKLYPDAKREVAALRAPGPYIKNVKTTRYVVRIFFKDSVAELESPEILIDDFAKVSYLRGAFLAGGTVTKPEKRYYLEISTTSESAANFIRQIFHDLEFTPTLYRRREFFVNYICEGDAVEEFLGMVGAEESVEHFGVVRNLKEVRANVNRLVNVETSNLNRTIEASQRQIADIRFLLENRVKVKRELKEVMRLRLLYPECALSELAEKLFLTKQAVKYRLQKIHELAEKTARQIELKKKLGIKS